MATAKKLEEKHQKILRQLQSEPDNKSCAECPTRAPGFVNLTNNSFVCMRCSGLVREFNHRVKSVSAGTFTPDEIKALQDGGNAICNKIWLASWKSSDYPAPNGSDVSTLKEWLRLKYVNKRWCASERQQQQILGDSRQTEKRQQAFSAPSAVFNDHNSENYHAAAVSPTSLNSAGGDFYGSFTSPPSASTFNPPNVQSPNAILSYQQQQQQPVQDLFLSNFNSTSMTPTSSGSNISFGAVPGTSSFHPQQQQIQPTVNTGFNSFSTSSMLQPSSASGLPLTSLSTGPLPLTVASNAPASKSPSADRYDIFRNLDSENENSSVFGAAPTVQSTQQARGGVFGSTTQSTPSSSLANPFANFSSFGGAAETHATLSYNANPFESFQRAAVAPQTNGMGSNPFLNSLVQQQQPRFNTAQQQMQNNNTGFYVTTTAQANPFGVSNERTFNSFQEQTPRANPFEMGQGQVQNPFFNYSNGSNGNNMAIQQSNIVAIPSQPPPQQQNNDPFAALVGYKF